MLEVTKAQETHSKLAESSSKSPRFFRVRTWSIPRWWSLSTPKVLSLGCFEQRFVEVSYSSYWLKKYKYPKSVLDSAVVKFRPVQGTWIFSTNNHCRIPQRIAARSNQGRRRLQPNSPDGTCVTELSKVFFARPCTA